MEKSAKPGDPKSDYVTSIFTFGIIGVILSLVIGDALDFLLKNMVYVLPRTGTIADTTYVIADLIHIFIIIPMLGPAFALLILSLVFILTTACLFVAKIATKAGEITMRRIAESSKGPILAISGLIGAISGVVKIFVHL